MVTAPDASQITGLPRSLELRSCNVTPVPMLIRREVEDVVACRIQPKRSWIEDISAGGGVVESTLGTGRAATKLRASAGGDEQQNGDKA